MTTVQSPFLQSFQGPSDSQLRGNAVSGYTQVSRVGESVINSFVDPYEFGLVPAALTKMELVGDAFRKDDDKLFETKDPATEVTGLNPIVETKPHFYEWATAYTGMIAVQRRQRSTFRAYVAAETAAPVIVCAAGKNPIDEFDFQFAGVVRSNSVRTMDDGVGPTEDEYFTLTIGGPQTILNTSPGVIHPGDAIAWCFYSEDKAKTGAGIQRQSKGSPRRIGIRVKTGPMKRPHCSISASCMAPHTHTPSRPCQPQIHSHSSRSPTLVSRLQGCWIP